MGPAAHGIMFNGLDGEEPEWQIMPMPVRRRGGRGGLLGDAPTKHWQGGVWRAGALAGCNRHGAGEG